MRYALISDLHANMQAWKVVYEDIQSNSVDRIICLGDVVGYGPNPSEIIRELRNKVDAFVLGNHDAAVCDKMDASCFNDDARKIIEWTRKQLSEDDLKFMGYFPLTLIGDGFLCAHAEFAGPANFDYVLEANEALPSWKATESNLLIVGHTHEPALYVLGASGVPRTVEPQDFAVDPGKRYFVNLGSVGQPRGSDARSCYCIYDTETKSIYWRRVAFDVDAYRKALQATGLNLDPSYYMLPEPKTAEGAAPAKRRIVFTPPKSTDKGARNVVTVQDLKTIPPRKKRLPLNVISTVVVILAILVVFVWKRTHPAQDFDHASKRLIPSSAKTILSIVRDVVEPGNEIPGWSTHVDNRYHQRIGVNLDTFNMPFYYLTSKDEKEGLALASSWIAVQPNQCWDVDASFQVKKDVIGDARLKINLIRMHKGKQEEVRDFFMRVPQAAAPGGWTRIHERITIPEEGTLIQFQVQGKFKGTVLVRQMLLTLLKGDAIATLQPAAPVEEVAKPAEAAPAPEVKDAAEAPAKPAATDAAAPAPATEATPIDPWKQKVQ